MSSSCTDVEQTARAQSPSFNTYFMDHPPILHHPSDGSRFASLPVVRTKIRSMSHFSRFSMLKLSAEAITPDLFPLGFLNHCLGGCAGVLVAKSSECLGVNPHLPGQNRDTHCRSK